MLLSVLILITDVFTGINHSIMFSISLYIRPSILSIQIWHQYPMINFLGFGGQKSSSHSRQHYILETPEENFITSGTRPLGLM